MTDTTPDAPLAGRPPWGKNPFASLLKFQAPAVVDGSAYMELVVEEIHLRPGGVVHGGVYATLLDTVSGYGAYISAPAGCEVLTIQLNMNMTATAQLGDRLIAKAKAVHVGRRTAVVNGEIRLPNGKLIVTGSGTFFFVDGGLKS